jgi:hypothetical protein
MSVVTFPTNTTTLLVNTLFTSKIVYLPPIQTANPGTVYFIKDICGNAAVSSIYIYANGTDTIERQNTGTASALLNANFGSIMLTPDGLNNWMILQHYNTNSVAKLWRYPPLTPIGLTLTLNATNGYLLAAWTQTPYTNTYTITFYQNTTAAIGGSATTLQTYTSVTSLTAITTSALTSSYYYYYTLVGTNPLGNSPTVTSAIVQATLYPAPPTNVAITFTVPSLTATWTASATASSYSLIFYSSPVAATTGGAPLQLFTGITGTSQINTTTLFNGYFYAVVTSLNSFGYSVGATSATSVFVNVFPNGPATVTVSFYFPTPSATPAIQCTWSIDAGATSYVVVFYQTPIAATSGGTLFETVTGITSTSQLTSITLLNNYYYYAIVRSVNSYGPSGPITSVSSVQATFVPTISSATMSFSGNQVTANWVGPSYAFYTVVFYQVATQITTGGTVLESFSGLTSTSKNSVTPIISGQYYYATVSATNSYGTSATITTNAIQASILPTGGAVTFNSFTSTGSSVTGGSVTITTPASLATGYTIYISTTPSSANSVYSFITTTTGSAVLFSASLSFNTIYYAVIIAYNIYGNSTSSVASSGVLSPTALYTYSGTLTFTPAGATGRSGPTLSQCRTAYSSYGSWVSNTAYFNMTTQGIQQWTIPQTKNYTFVCSGAGTGGIFGAILTATFSLTQGEIINILVGQSGQSGGSGGSFVVTSTGTPLIVAGGSGVSGGYAAFGQGPAGGDAVLTTSGGNGLSGSKLQGGGLSLGGSGGSGGSGGNGGGGDSYSSGPNTIVTIGGGGGGGFTGSSGGFSYTSGGLGGIDSLGNMTGGFGGGGQTGGIRTTSNVFVSSGGGGGGGGGYSGGGGGGAGYYTSGGGGGGGSYCFTTITSSSVTNSGQGYVQIT